jgi:tetratricopeptide (TPR) repeat protein
VLQAVVIAAFLLAEPADGVALFQERRFAAAEQSFRKRIAEHPNDRTARLYLARTLVELGRVQEALVEVERVLAGEPDAESRFQAGRLLRELAERRFAELQTTAPGSAATLELAGARFEWAGDLDEALKQYRAAAALDPARPGAHYRIANVLWRKREVDPAIKELALELAMNPHHALANMRMGQALISANREEKAIEYLERSVTAMPHSGEARRELGKAYRKVGRTAEARSQWEAVAKMLPNDDQVHYLLATLYRELGESALAKKELETHRSILERRRLRAQEQQR